MTKIASNGDVDKQAEILVEYLLQLSEGEILDFDSIYRQFMNQAFNLGLWKAAEIIEDGCGDDGFMDFRAWLIAQGQNIFESALAEPDSLADYVELGQETQKFALLYATRDAYEKQTGKEEMPRRIMRQDKPTGTWSDNPEQSHPKLYAKFDPFWDDYYKSP